MVLEDWRCFLFAGGRKKLPHTAVNCVPGFMKASYPHPLRLSLLPTAHLSSPSTSAQAASLPGTLLSYTSLYPSASHQGLLILEGEGLSCLCSELSLSLDKTQLSTEPEDHAVTSRCSDGGPYDRWRTEETNAQQKGLGRLL